ncbi:hypothetical protein D7024_01445 [Desulfofundulus salinus]|uniref:Uncharacterized protein n=1 Tax=Desulfofundulus salinus TaxID=2419843 RepID=A0A494WYQ5_9FIRM|nr:hypothetical protein D7024_01445 [Desulfofundulus salinum]
MGRNPAFGWWPLDDAFPDQVWKVENDHLTSRGPVAYLWDLRTGERKTLPCTVKLGSFLIEGVYFPRREKTAERVRELARRAVSIYGRKDHLAEYPLPAGLGRRLVPFYRYCIARLLVS